MVKKLAAHRFAVHSLALLLMLGTAVALYPAARANSPVLEILLLVGFASGAALTTLV